MQNLLVNEANNSVNEAFCLVNEANNSVNEAFCLVNEANNSVNEAFCLVNEANNSVNEAFCLVNETNNSVNEAFCLVNEANNSVNEAFCLVNEANNSVNELPKVPSPEIEPGIGSRFIIDSNREILTNAHVVNRVDTVSVMLKDGRNFKGKVNVSSTDGFNKPSARGKGKGKRLILAFPYPLTFFLFPLLPSSEILPLNSR
ncbi:hypothetical protein NIES2100_38240 [Calothrix sp. NIES-2100]|nr:hypothetical protein NIES2100_38240 [Calothrix sp. NIES-2100]